MAPAGALFADSVQHAGPGEIGEVMAGRFGERPVCRIRSWRIDEPRIGPPKAVRPGPSRSMAPGRTFDQHIGVCCEPHNQAAPSAA